MELKKWMLAYTWSSIKGRKTIVGDTAETYIMRDIGIHNVNAILNIYVCPLTMHSIKIWYKFGSQGVEAGLCGEKSDRF